MISGVGTPLITVLNPRYRLAIPSVSSVPLMTEKASLSAVSSKVTHNRVLMIDTGYRANVNPVKRGQPPQCNI